MNKLLNNKPDTRQLRLEIKKSAAGTRIERDEARRTLKRARKLKAKLSPQTSVYESDEKVRDLYWRYDSLRDNSYDGAQRYRHLALGFLRGTPYKRMEATCRFDPSLDAIMSYARACINKKDMSDKHLKIALTLWFKGLEDSECVADIEYHKELASLQHKVEKAEAEVAKTNKAIEDAKVKISAAERFIAASKETLQEKDAAAREAQSALETFKREGVPSSRNNGDPLGNIKAAGGAA